MFAHHRGRAMFKLFSRQTKTETPAPQPVDVRALTLEDIFGVSASASGLSVSASTAMRAPAVRAAVQAISEACGQLPLVVVETAAGGLRKPAEGHPLFSILNGAANDWTPAPAFREQLVRDALLHGAGFGWVGRDGTGAVRELVRLRPGVVTVDEDVTAPLGPPVYRIDGNVVSGRDLIHLRCPLGPDGAHGVGPVQDAREAIALALALEQHAARLFGRGARPSGILSFPGRLGAEVAARVKASWQSAHGGSNSGGTAVLEEGAKFEALTMTSTDAQFAELRAFQLAEVARAFRVPPAILQDFSKVTYKNSDEMSRQFVNFTLQPWLLKIEGELAIKLFAEEERGHLVLEHDVDQLVNAVLLERAQAAQMFRSAGVMTANELRRLENLPPHADGDALTNPYTDTAKAPTSGGPTNG